MQPPWRVILPALLALVVALSWSCASAQGACYSFPTQCCQAPVCRDPQNATDNLYVTTYIVKCGNVQNCNPLKYVACIRSSTTGHCLATGSVMTAIPVTASKAPSSPNCISMPTECCGAPRCLDSNSESDRVNITHYEAKCGPVSKCHVYQYVNCVYSEPHAGCVASGQATSFVRDQTTVTPTTTTAAPLSTAATASTVSTSATTTAAAMPTPSRAAYIIVELTVPCSSKQYTKTQFQTNLQESLSTPRVYIINYSVNHSVCDASFFVRDTNHNPIAAQLIRKQLIRNETVVLNVFGAPSVSVSIPGLPIPGPTAASRVLPTWSVAIIVIVVVILLLLTGVGIYRRRNNVHGGNRQGIARSDGDSDGLLNPGENSDDSDDEIMP